MLYQEFMSHQGGEGALYTYIACQEPSQSKFIAKYLPYKESNTMLLEAVQGLYVMNQQWQITMQEWSCAAKLTVELYRH